MPEEDAFVVLVSLMFEHQLRNLYKPNMSELGLCMHQLDCLVEENLPKLALHFRSHNFHATVYASGWFLTLFTLSFSIDLASKVMDLFMVEVLWILLIFNYYGHWNYLSHKECGALFCLERIWSWVHWIMTERTIET